MSFAWPLALLALGIAPALLGAYALLLRRRRKQAIRYSSVALLRSVLPRRSRWKRHLPVAMLLLSLVALGFSAGRPHVERDVPVARTSIILALDVSGSMCASDVEPNRLTVAQAAARRFVEDQPKGVRIGLVVFSGFAQLAVSSTTDREPLIAAIDTLTTGRGTAIGAAMLKSLDAISETNPSVFPVGDFPEAPSTGGTGPPGANGYVPDIIVLLTDGANNRGIEPLDAVPYAVERRVRVFTIGFGTTNPAPPACTQAQRGGDVFQNFRGGPGRFGGPGGFRRAADVPTMMAVAKQTGARYYGAKNAGQLREVFADLPKAVATQKQQTEVTWAFAALGALLAALAVGASIRWSPSP